MSKTDIYSMESNCSEQQPHVTLIDDIIADGKDKYSNHNKTICMDTYESASKALHITYTKPYLHQVHYDYGWSEFKRIAVNHYGVERSLRNDTKVTNNDYTRRNIDSTTRRNEIPRHEAIESPATIYTSTSNIHQQNMRLFRGSHEQSANSDTYVYSIHGRGTSNKQRYEDCGFAKEFKSLPDMNSMLRRTLLSRLEAVFSMTKDDVECLLRLLSERNIDDPSNDENILHSFANLSDVELMLIQRFKDQWIETKLSSYVILSQTIMKLNDLNILISQNRSLADSIRSLERETSVVANAISRKP